MNLRCRNDASIAFLSIEGPSRSRRESASILRQLHQSSIHRRQTSDFVESFAKITSRDGLAGAPDRIIRLVRYLRMIG